jgi:putative chitinase
MAVQVTLSQVATLAPSCRSSYRDAFAAGQDVLDAFGISVNALRVAHFMAQILHESGGFTIQFENLNYSPERLPVVWPTRFKPKGPLDPQLFAHNPQRLANEVYGHRMGNTAPGDGFLYRGRGLLQITGKESYAEATATMRQTSATAPDFTITPDNVIDAEWCLRVAAAEWQSKGCNALGDNDDITMITQRINGGQTGIAERKEWAKRTKLIWH